MKHREPIDETIAQKATADGEKKVKKGKKKKFGPVRTSICIVSTAAVLAVGTWACIAFMRPQVRNNVAEDYGSVCFEVKDGEIFSESAFVPLKERDENDVVLSRDAEGTYDAVDIYGRLNYVFQQQTNWYSEMHSQVQTAVGIQNVETYKRFADGILISSDITTSSLVNDAREFCYIGDRVIWRESDESKDKWDGLNTVFSDGAPDGNMQISGEEGFKKKNGLPATELSVYVIKASTVESAELKSSDTATTADGTKLYTVVYHLRPKTDEDGSTGAAAYYGNQMVFSGGIDAPPTFDYITLSFTFTEDWYPVACEVDESYTATMKTIVSSCSSHSRTEYTYGVSGLGEEVKEIYDDYYKQYAAAEATGEADRPLTATECLASAFSPMLSGPCNLDIDLTLDGKDIHGSVYLDLGDALDGDLSTTELRLRLDDFLGAWVEKGTVYLSYGDMKFSIGLDRLIGLIASPAAQEETGESSDDILASLANGEFTLDENSAHLHSVLSLGDAEAVLDFYFAVDAEKNVALDRVEATLRYSDLQLSARAAFAEEGPAPLTFVEKARFIDIGAYAEDLKELFTSDYLGIDVNYQNADLGLSVKGKASVDLVEGSLGGKFILGYGGAEKPVSLFYDGETAYIDLDGVKFKTTFTEILALITQFVPMSDLIDMSVTVSLTDIVGALLDGEFASGFRAQKAGDALVLTLQGTEILKALGLDFSIGEVTLSVTDEGCLIEAYGADITLSEGEKMDFDLEGYAQVIPYAINLYSLFRDGNLHAALSYENAAQDIEITGTVQLGLDPVVAAAELHLDIKGVEKDLFVAYAERDVYIGLDGIKLKANIDDVKDALRLDDLTSDTQIDITKVLGVVLSVDFSSILTTLKNGDNSLEIGLALDALVEAFGFGADDFTLGNASVTVKNDSVTLSALGADVTLTKGAAPVLPDDLDTYVDVIPAVGTVLGLIENNFVTVALNYVGDVDITGKIDLDINALNVLLDLTVTSGETQNRITVGYVNAEKNLYLTVDGLKIKAGVDEIASLVGTLLPQTTAGTDALLSLLENLADIVQVGQNEDGGLKLTLALDAILDAFNIDLGASLGDGVLEEKDGKLSFTLLDGDLTAEVEQGTSFTVDTAEYVEVMPYVMAIYELIRGGNLHISLSYENAAQDIAVSGTVDLGLDPVAAVADLTLTLQGVEKKLSVIYADNNVYVAVDDIKLKANVNDITALLDLGNTDNTQQLDLAKILGTVFSVNFSDILTTLKNGDSSLEVSLALDALVGALGFDTKNALGEADITVTKSVVTLTAAGVRAELTEGTAPTIPDGLDTYADVMPLVQTALELFNDNSNLRADVLLTLGELSISGTVDFNIQSLNVSADLAINYSTEEKQLTKRLKIYFVGDGMVYVNVDDLRLKVDIDKTVELISSLTGGTMGEPAEEALSPVLQLLQNLNTVLQNVKTEDGTFTAQVDLYTIFEIFGIEPLLGDVKIAADGKTLTVTTEQEDVTLTVAKGEDFSCETYGYVDVISYVEALIDLFTNENGTIAAEVSYSSDKLGLSLNGDLTLSLDALQNITPESQVLYGEFVVSYKGIHVDLNLAYYGDESILAEVNGLKVKGNTESILALVGVILEMTNVDLSSSTEGLEITLEQLLESVFNIDFGEYITLSETISGEKRTLSILIQATELLKALNIDFGIDLGQLVVRVSEGELGLSALGANVTLTAGQPLPALNKGDYTDIDAVLTTAAALLANKNLSADVHYNGKFSVDGTVNFSFKNFDDLKLAAILTVGYEGAEQNVRIYYDGGYFYLNLGGVKLRTTLEEIKELVALFTKDNTSTTPDIYAIVGDILDDLSDIITSTQSENGTFSAEVALGTILKSLGIVSDAKVSLTVGNGEIGIEALENALTLNISAGQTFETDTDGYTEVVPYILGIADLFQKDYLQIAVDYTSDAWTLDGTLTVGTKEGIVYGEFTLTVDGTTVPVTLVYSGGVLYLNANGLKLKAEGAELSALVQKLTATGTDGEAGLLAGLLGLDFEKVISTLRASGDGLEIQLALDEILKALGLNFVLGEADITVTKSVVTLTAAGVRAELTEGTAPTIPDGLDTYADVMPLVQTALELFNDNSNLRADVLLTLGELSISGTVDFNIKTLNVAADLSINYNTEEKQLTKRLKIYFVGGGMVYVNVDDLRLKVDIDKTVELISSLLGETMEEPAEEALSPVLQLLQKLDDVLKNVQTENGTFTAQVDLYTIFEIFGISPLLGDVKIAADGKTLTVTTEQEDVKLTVAKGEDFSCDTYGYIDVISYVEALIDLFTNENGTIAAEVSYSSEELGLVLNGNLTLSLDALINGGDESQVLYGEFVVSYKGIHIDLNLAYYGDESILAEVNGLKVKGTTNNILTLVGVILEMANVDLPSTEGLEITLEQLLESVFNINFGEYITLSETVSGEKRTLSILIQATELLNALNIDLGIDLGQLVVRVSEGELGLSALGADVTLTAGQPLPALNKEDYTDIDAVLTTAAALLAERNLSANVHYNGKFSVDGTVNFSFVDLNDLKLAAILTVGYEGAEQQVRIYYDGGYFYLNLGGVKLRTTLEEIKELVALFTKDNTSSTPDLYAIVGDILDDLSDIITSTQSENGTFSAEVALGTLLKSLGIVSDAKVSLTVGNGKIDITALETFSMSVKLAASDPATPDKPAYVDAAQLLAAVKAFVDAQGISFSNTDLTLFYGEKQIAVYLKNAGISWKNGFAFRGDIEFSINATSHRISVYADEAHAQICYGNLMADIVYADFGEISEAFGAVVAQIKDYIKDIMGVEKQEGELLSTLSLAEGGEALSGFVGEIADLVKNFRDGAKNFTLADLLKGLSLGTGTDRATGKKYFTLTLNDVLGASAGLRLLADGSAADLKLTLPAAEGSALEGLKLLGTVEFSPLEALAAMPTKVTTLGTDEFLNIIGYFGSAVSLLNTTDLSLTFEGKVLSDDTDTIHYPIEEGETIGTKYGIKASMQTHRGKNDLFHLDVDGKNFWIDSDVFIHASVNVEAKGELKDTAPEGSKLDQSIYIDMYIIDGVPENTGGDIAFEKNTKIESLAKDGNLDFYVTLSQFGPVGSTVPGYKPVMLYAPANEIMTLLSSALPMFGIDVSILNDFMVMKWLTDLNTVNQLKAFGTVVQPLLGGLFGKGEADNGASDTPAAAALDETESTNVFNLGDYLTGLKIEDVKDEEGKVSNQLLIALNSETLYGINGLENVTATLTKEKDSVKASLTQGDVIENKTVFGKFKTLTLQNIYDKEGVTNTSLEGTIDYEKIEPSVPNGTYQSFLGAEKLLAALAKSATHVDEDEEVISGEETPHTYAVNDNFYIDGKITASLFGVVDATINLVAISVTVDEDGALGINLRLQYQGVHMILSAIQGDSTIDITIKNGMVYMKREQTSITKGKYWNEILDTPIILYRAMPLENFMGDILGQLGFILNFGEMINNEIEKGKSNSGTTTPPATEKVDFGATLSKVLSSYTFTESTEGNTWNLAINGLSFSNNILGDLRAEIKTDANGYVRGITLSDVKIYPLGYKEGLIKPLELSLNAELHWRNPGGVMEEGTSDKTNDISTEVGAENGMGGMIEKLNGEKGWDDPAKTDDNGKVFLEAKPFTVTYKYNTYEGGTADLGSQKIMVSTGADGYPEFTLYSTLTYPDLPDDGVEFSYERTVEHIQIGDAVPADGNIVFGKQAKNRYTVTFLSEYDFGEGWELNGDYYCREFDMEYGATVIVGGTGYTVTDTENREIYILNADATVGVRAGHWTEAPEFTPQGVEFVPEIQGDTIIYNSEIEFTMEGAEGSVQRYETTYMADYTLTTPSASGYTFLGWFEKTDDGWELVKDRKFDPVIEVQTTEVEALWQQNDMNDMFSVELETVRTIGTSNRYWYEDYEISWKYESTLTIKGDCLVGAMTRDESFIRTINVNHYLADDNENKKLFVTNSPNISQTEGCTIYTWEQIWDGDSRNLLKNYKRSHSYATVTFTYQIAGLDDIVVTVNVWDQYI